MTDDIHTYQKNGPRVFPADVEKSPGRTLALGLGGL